jgi:GTP-binding protein Era
MIDEALAAAREVDVLCFVVEAVEKIGIHKADVAALEQLEKAGALKAPVVLVVNKVDTLTDKKALLPLLDAWSKRFEFGALIPISAAKQNGIDVLVDDLAQRMPEAAWLFDEDALTDASERDIAGELIREKVMLELRQELPYRAAVVVEDFDESRRSDAKKPLVHVAAVIHVEKESQKAMVIGKKGQRVKAIGERSRKELERLLGCQVMLELLVRVEPDWTSSDKGLAKVGYKRS